jgi:hypothetical protein
MLDWNTMTQAQRVALHHARNTDLCAFAALLMDYTTSTAEACEAARALLSYSEANIVAGYVADYNAVPVCTFDSTGDAYDAVQTGAAPLGAVLLVPSEHVAGVADVWPFAVTAAHGALHLPVAGTPDHVHVLNCGGRITAASIVKARTLAARLGFA